MASKSIDPGSTTDAGSAADAASSGAATPSVPMGEAAASNDARDITLGFFGNMRQMQDSILAARGGGLEIYEEVLRDWQCYPTFQQRRRAVVSKEWGVEPGAKDKASVMAAESLKAQLEAIGFDNATDKMLFGIWYGYAAGECMWARDGSEVIIDRIKVRKARRFRYDMEGHLRLLTRANSIDGEVMPDRKFWTFCTGADNDDDPYGIGLGHYCYWPVWLKKNGYRFWAMLLDKFGAPTGVGKFPAGASKEDQAKLLGAISAIQSSSGIIIPEEMMIELLEASRSGSVGNEGFVDRMDAAIAKVVLSQTMTTDNGASRAQGQVHEGVKEEVVKGDADLVCSSFNQGPSKWLTDWNYPGAVPPKVWRKIEPPEDLDKLADRDSKIYQMGFEPSEEYVKETYGEGWTKRQAAPAPVLPGLPGNPLPKNDPAKPASSASFAEPQTASAVRQLAEQADMIAGHSVDALIDDIRQMLETSRTMQEFEQQLMLAYPKLSIADVAAVIRDATVVAELTGRVDQETSNQA